MDFYIFYYRIFINLAWLINFVKKKGSYINFIKALMKIFVNASILCPNCVKIRMNVRVLNSNKSDKPQLQTTIPIYKCMFYVYACLNNCLKSI